LRVQLNEVFKTAKFKLRLSKREKRSLRSVMTKYTNAIGDILKLIEPDSEKIEFDILAVKQTRYKEKYYVDINRLSHIVKEYVNNSVYKNYCRKEILIEQVKTTLGSYFALRLNGESPGYPSKINVGDKERRDELIKEAYSKLRACV